VAQLGARFHGMEEVVGSIPTRSTKYKIKDLQAKNILQKTAQFKPKYSKFYASS
jgi:hypothetical protein